MARLDNQYWSKHFVSAKRVITPTRLNQVTKQTGESSMASL
jgi:hypothetical protein